MIGISRPDGACRCHNPNSCSSNEIWNEAQGPCLISLAASKSASVIVLPLIMFEGQAVSPSSARVEILRPSCSQVAVAVFSITCARVLCTDNRAKQVIARRAHNLAIRVRGTSTVPTLGGLGALARDRRSVDRHAEIDSARGGPCNVAQAIGIAGAVAAVISAVDKDPETSVIRNIGG